MNFDFEKILRYFLFFLGFIGLIFVAYNMYVLFSSIFNNSLEDFTTNQIFFSKDLLIMGIIAFISYYLIKVSYKWKDFFLSFSKSLISFAIIFFSLSFVFFAIGNNYEELTNSIQPSIDLILLSSVDELINLNTVSQDMSFNFSYYQNPIYLNIKNSDLNSEEITILAKKFNIENLEQNKKEFIIKFLITEMSKELNKNQFSDSIVIPLSFLEKINYDSDIQIINSLDMNSVSNLYQFDNSSELVFVYGDEFKTYNFDLNNPDEKLIEIMWLNLGLAENISLETKTIYLNFLFSQMSQFIYSNDYFSESISIETLSSVIPDEIKNIFNIDLFSPDINTRLDSLNDLRNNCDTNSVYKNSQYISSICEQILLTNYDNIAKDLDSIKYLEIENQLDNNYDDSNEDLENDSNIGSFSSLEQIRIYFSEYKIKFYKFFFIGLILILLTIISYLIHLKINILPDSHSEIGYFISKYNLLFYLPSYIISLILFYLLFTDILFDLIYNLFSSFLSFDTQILSQLMIISVIKDISLEFIILSTFYLLFSILIYLSYFLFDKKFKNKKINSQVESSNSYDLTKFENPSSSEVVYDTEK